MDFFKLFAILVLLGGGAWLTRHLVPYPALVVAAIAVLALAIHHHRNRSLA